MGNFDPITEKDTPLSPVKPHATSKVLSALKPNAATRVGPLHEENKLKQPSINSKNRKRPSIMFGMFGGSGSDQNQTSVESLQGLNSMLKKRHSKP